MLTEKDYCDYETCVALKELGYDGYCAAYYHLFDDDEDARNSFEYAYGFDFQNSNNIYRVGAPLLYQAQKWLREEKKIGVFVSGFKNGYTFWVNNLLNGDTLYQGFFDNQTGEKYKSYEEALAEGLRTSIKILQDE